MLLMNLALISGIDVTKIFAPSSSAARSFGVEMSRVSEIDCIVRWVGDSHYTEPYTIGGHYSTFLVPVQASEILPLSSVNSIYKFRLIFEKIMVLTPLVYLYYV